MIAVLFILLPIYLVVFQASRPGSGGTLSSRLRSLRYSIIVTITLFGYSIIQSNNPPFVDYYANGWIYVIAQLNAHYASIGNPNRMANPGK